MTVRENIQFYHQFDVDTYLSVLKYEYGAREHPKQPGSYLIEDLPFYAPKNVDDHVSVLGFNYAPLSSILIEALANYRELVPDEVLIIWTIEQDLILEATMGAVREQLNETGE